MNPKLPKYLILIPLIITLLILADRERESGPDSMTTQPANTEEAK